jgi:hypothetical protein
MNIFRIPKPIRKVSKRRKARSGKPGKLGIVRLYGKDKTDLRRRCYEQDNERCVICRKWLPFDGPILARMHMAHILGIGAGGSDTIGNVETRCAEHHLVDGHNPKPCPPKVKAT